MVRPRFAWAAFLFVFAICAPGCGPSAGKVTGKVTFQHKAVVWGTVSAIGSDGIQYAGQIQPDGTYVIDRVAGGPATFCVSSPNPYGQNRGKGRGGIGDGGNATAPTSTVLQGAWFAIPEKYGDPQTSDLKGAVQSDTVIDLVLQP